MVSEWSVRSCAMRVFTNRNGFSKVVGQDHIQPRQEECQSPVGWQRRAGIAALLAVGLLAVAAMVRGPRWRPVPDRPQEAARSTAFPELRGAWEAEACDCDWAKPNTCKGSDSTGCYRFCCNNVKMHLSRTSAADHGVVKLMDGGEDVCGHTCMCSWANAFVCGNPAGNCCAKYCCAQFHTSQTTTTEHPAGSTTTVTLKPVIKKCDNCTCDCSWTQRWPCLWDDTQQTCCGECCCGPRPKERSMWCWVLMRPPPNYETGLVRFQFHKRLGIFGCDGYAVYSNQSLVLGNSTKTRVVDSNLSCSVGGEFKTALNLHIFMTLWNKIIADGDYAGYGWTVKVDPDSVFHPERLRSVFKYGSIKDKVYFNNCKFGLHGPIEVFSRNAVQAWGWGKDQCDAHFRKLCAGDCFWGEDMFIDQCLSRVLKVRRELKDSLLVEDHCDAPEGWADCSDQKFVAYHPFKNVSKWYTCWSKAQ